MDLIQDDGAQPSLHLDEYVCARTIYIYGLVALLVGIRLLQQLVIQQLVVIQIE
jgi:hypothetical protein